MSFSREGMTVVVVVVEEVNYPSNHKILLTEHHHQPLHHQLNRGNISMIDQQSVSLRKYLNDINCPNQLENISMLY